ncbi:MAG: DUF1501 domain-containing protein [Gemmataceae bacterium]|nr:DUF1501 domain-containing protein [Gemmataceae bacterium]
MLNISGTKQRLCNGLSRRDFLKVGALGVGGFSLANLLQLKAQGAVRPESSSKAIIMVYLNGGPSHMDMYDLKPEAPVEYRGEFKPIHTNVPGMDICELFPLQAKIADKMAIIRNMKFQQQGHTSPELYTGFLNGNRPSIGSVVSKLRGDAGVLGTLPPYVALGDANHVGSPGFLGTAYQPFLPGSQSAASMGMRAGFTMDRIGDRKTLLSSFDTLHRDMDDGHGSLKGMDAFTTQAMEMITTTKARDAFDLTREPLRAREKYGKQTEYLLARRLVEAGVPVVTLTPQNHGIDEKSKCNGQWDHHDHIFKCLRMVLPQLDQSVYALVTDLYERGLDKDVAVVIWGEMGRTPRVGTQQGTSGGRDHWPQSGFALMIGGGLPMGQVIGATDPRGERPKGHGYTPQNVLATLYGVLGIDASQTALPDHMGRPIHLLEDPEKIKELA